MSHIKSEISRFSNLLLRERDLDESFFGEEPSAAYDPVFVSGDDAGRTVVHMTNMLTHGRHPATKAHESALFTNVAGSVVFHHVAQFDEKSCLDIYRQLLNAVHGCTAYCMELNDGVRLDIRRESVESLAVAERAFLVRWVSVVDQFRIETAWSVAADGGILNFVNTRIPDKSEVVRLANIVVQRAKEARGTI